ncbi:MAG TPA: heavy metal translocating P-type ATPase [Methanospirillum sp.]|uniref:heavy metal translocating P-type ATPase n=1 Tax=Methanospirillum sp. TaxID=45200 RepID=UPI002D0D70FE|nr:heavy metal translocating P-type ATPase [Methanospirillum sp.]HOJ95933.1 heavy metal translocating P-type ATPase [Methanospirillum sp.]
MGEEKKKEIELQITGMHCATCALTVEKSLSSTPGVLASSVNLATGKARVSYDPSYASLSDMTKAVEKSGFKVALEKVVVRVGGMTCASCVQTVTRALTALDGVVSVTVNLATERAYISYNPSRIDVRKIRDAIQSAGYQYLGTDRDEMNEGEIIQERELKSQLFKIIIGFAFSFIIMGMMYIPAHDMHLVSFLQCIVTTPVLFWLGKPIFQAAISALRLKTLNMDVMYAMGISVAYLASVLGTFSIILDMSTLFYETALMLTAFLSLGRYLEARAKGRTSSAIASLIGLQPDTASVIRNGTEKQIPVQDVIIGDIIRMRPGERIPVDGVIVSGSSYVDESMVTGEPLAVFREPGHEVIGGTLVITGTCTYEATRVGSDTMLARIIRLVEEAQGSRPPVQRIADSAVAWFIPFVLTIAIVSFLYWYGIRGMDLRFSLQTLIAVLVVACPCALGLATPTAVTVGIGRGAELGILIRNGSVLEIADTINVALFDKTGTITRGKPVVTDVDSFTGNPNLLLSMAASLEFLSDHPLSSAILEKAQQEGIEPAEVSSFQTITGSGLTGMISGGIVRLGAPEFILSQNLPIKLEEAELLSKREKEGKTTILVSRDERILGIISLADQIKSDASLCVRLLKEMGIRSGMVTGDNHITARAVASMVGIHDIHARILPEGKEEEVAKVQKDGNVVAFIGDGLNDAPALARADTGIAIGSGTDVAIESADIVLVRDSLIHIPASLQLARKVMGRIRLNLFWAFAYNSILIPLAAGILYPAIQFRPEYGALAMALSSVTVITLSLLLKRYTPPALDHEKKPGMHIDMPEIDPVCGMSVQSETAEFISEYQGKTYYFCNKGCKDAFDTDPDRYIK